MLNSQIQKVSYVIGRDIGRNLQSQGIVVDATALALGVTDFMAKAENRLSDEEIEVAMGAFQAEMESKKAESQQGLSQQNQQEGSQFLKENAKKPGVVTLPSGLQYKELRAGGGRSPNPSDEVVTHYHGTLIDGTVFDSSFDRNEPVRFPVNRVIAGWTEALQLMKEGSMWELYIPSELAYGSRGAGDAIGPNATLIFKVELLSIA